MKAIQQFFVVIFLGTLLTSCVVYEENSFIEPETSINQLVSEYDLWYIDYHKTTGTGDIPFVSRSFTLSFLNGILYANNNITDIGLTGNGLGILVGTYYAQGRILEVNHEIDGFHDFEIFQESANEIRIYNYKENVNYYLVGYQKNKFDYDKLFYDNIEYFLQEYAAWEKTNTSVSSDANGFDKETYLQFTPENITTFYSSIDGFGKDVTQINWGFVGNYEIFDVAKNSDLKILTLNYDIGDIEKFELSVINDSNINLYHITSKTNYEFKGRGFIRYEKSKKLKISVRNSNRKRTKIKRRLKI